MQSISRDTNPPAINNEIDVPKNDTPSLVNPRIVAAQILSGASSFAGGVVACFTASALIANPIGIGLCCGLACLAIAGLIFVGLNGSRQDFGLTLFAAGMIWMLGFASAMIAGFFIGGAVDAAVDGLGYLVIPQLLVPGLIGCIGMATVAFKPETPKPQELVCVSNVFLNDKTHP